MRRLTSSPRELRGSLRATIVVLVVLMAASAAIRAAITVDDLGDQAAANSALSYSDREIAGGNAVVVEQEAIYQAAARIAVGESFRVVVGESYEEGGELTATYVESFYRSFLMPRRTASDAEWVICYGCDLGSLGGTATVVWRGPEEISIARVGQ